MVIGLAFLLLSALLVLAIGYYALLDRHRALAVLDRRIGSLGHAVVAARLRPQMRVPDLIAPLLAQAQIEPTPRMALTILGLYAVLFPATLLLAGPAAALIAAVVPVAALVLYIRQRARTRVELLIDALPFYLDGVRQLLTVGGSLPQALSRALPAASLEVQAFIGPATRRIDLGAPVTDSMQALADRLRVPEISMLVAAIRVNLRFGGPMATVLSNLAQIVRERVRIKRELRSATSEVKMSTRLLILLPIGMVVFLLVTNRSYIDFFVHEPKGHVLAAIAIGLQLSGILVMRYLMRPAF